MAASVQEIVSFHRCSELPGVELRSTRDSARAFSVYATDFEFAAPSSWRGEVWHRRQQNTLEPGAVLCIHPGDVVDARRVLSPGAGNVLTIESEILSSYFVEHCERERVVHLKPIVTMSPLLRGALAELFRTIRCGASSLELESAMLSFIAAAASELLSEPPPTTRPDADARAAERVRQCLHEEPSMTTDLSTLAQRTGMSRFRVLRVFKRHFGLPPHAYQLRMRLGLAQRALRAGEQPAHVAAELGFVDQSHMTRHFRRLLGVTPAQYARLGGWRQPRRALPQLEAQVA